MNKRYKIEKLTKSLVSYLILYHNSLYLYFSKENMLQNGYIFLKDKSKPIENMEALKFIINADPSHALSSLSTEINSDGCFLLNIASTGDEFYDGHNWKLTKGATSKFYSLIQQNGQDKIELGKRGKTWFKVTRFRAVNSSSTDLHRLVIVTEDSSKVKGDVAVVQYRYDGEPHKIICKPHGNSITNTTPNIPTKRTVLGRIADEVKLQKSNKKVLHKVEEEQGGLFASCPGDIPKNKRQVRYIKTKINNSSPDPMLEVLALQSNEDERFIQRVCSYILNFYFLSPSVCIYFVYYNYYYTYNLKVSKVFTT